MPHHRIALASYRPGVRCGALPDGPQRAHARYR